MPATLAQLRKKTHTVKVEIDGDPEAITVEVSTRKLTPRVQEEIARAVAEASDDDQRPVIRQFLVMVESWDFAADAGQEPIPLEEEALMDVPIDVIGAVLQAVTDKLADLAPKGATETSSNGRSPDPLTTNSP